MNLIYLFSSIIWEHSACVLSHYGHAWLCDPVDYSQPGFCVHGILQTTILEWVAIFFSMRIFYSLVININILKVWLGKNRADIIKQLLTASNFGWIAVSTINFMWINRHSPRQGSLVYQSIRCKVIWSFNIHQIQHSNIMLIYLLPEMLEHLFMFKDLNLRFKFEKILWISLML